MDIETSSPAGAALHNGRPTVIAVRDLVKVYGAGQNAIRALDGISMEVRAGEVVLLMGPSGSGKSTLLSILGCILRPTSGSVRIKGAEMTGLPERDMAKSRLAHIGFVFQSYNLFPTLRAVENVMVALDLKGARGPEARQKAVEVMAAVGLEGYQEALPDNLSGGQKQRLAIARALAGSPEIILTDEPTAALDSDNGRKLMGVLRSLAENLGRAVVIVTHDNRILDFADRIVYIEDGKITRDGAHPRAPVTPSAKESARP